MKGHVWFMPCGGRAWYDGDENLHRVDGPAIERTWIKSWWLHGKRHRVGGPAVDHGDGYREWWVAGQFIRDERPRGPTDEVPGRGKD